MLLHYGGDYELLVTLPEDCFAATQATLKKHGSTLTLIGTVTSTPRILLDDGKSIKTLPNKGYEHFTASWKSLPEASLESARFVQ